MELDARIIHIAKCRAIALLEVASASCARSTNFFLNPMRTLQNETLHLFNIKALFRLPQNFKFFHSLFITSIFGRIYEALNVGKKNN